VTAELDFAAKLRGVQFGASWHRSSRWRRPKGVFMRRRRLPRKREANPTPNITNVEGSDTGVSSNARTSPSIQTLPNPNGMTSTSHDQGHAGRPRSLTNVSLSDDAAHVGFRNDN